MKYFALLLTCLPMSAFSQSINLEEWQEKWDNSLEYTLALLDKVDSSMLEYQPTPGQMTLAGQLGHMAGNMYFLSSRFLDHQPEGFNQEAVFKSLGELSDLESIKTALRESHQFASDAVHSLKPEQFDEEVDFFVGEKTRRVIAWLLQDHVTHHRGQLIVYLRLLGIEELPRYQGW